MSPGVLRPLAPGLALAAVLLATGCTPVADTPTDGPSPSGPSLPAAPSGPASGSSAPTPGPSPDAACGRGRVETKVVQAALGVSLTVPADWAVRVSREGAEFELSPPDVDKGVGYLLVERSGRTLDEVVKQSQESTRESARVVAETDLRRPGCGRGSRPSATTGRTRRTPWAWRRSAVASR